MKNLLAASAILLSIVAPAAAQTTADTPVLTDQNGAVKTGGETNSPKAVPSTDATGSIKVDPNAVNDGTGQNSSPQTEDSSQGGDRAVGGRSN